MSLAVSVELRKFKVATAAMLCGLLGCAATLAQAPQTELRLLAPSSFGRYPALRVSAGHAHPIAVGFGPRVTVLPWSGPGQQELLIGGIGKGFGTRLALYTPSGKRDAATGLPIYRYGDTVALPGKSFTPLLDDDGTFDLLGDGAGTTWGAGKLLLYRNTGKMGAPRFDAPSEVRVGDKSLGDYWNDAAPSEWTLSDVNGDGIADLLVTTAPKDQMSYFPDGVSMWNGKEHHSSGKGRGYDLDGNWLGGRLTVDFWWAEGRGKTGAPRGFGPVRRIFLGEPGVPLRWRAFHRYASPGVITLNQTRYLLAFGGVDQMRAMRLQLKEGELIASPPEPVLADGKAVHAVYVHANITAADIDGDGAEEILLAGNPGRVAVLRGTKMGGFVEVGSLQNYGGYVETDTLVTPVLVDWDHDGLRDLVTGDASGFLYFWPGTGNPLEFGSPVPFTEAGAPVHIQGGLRGSIQGPEERRWGYVLPTAGAWTKDGQPGLISIDANGDLFLWQRSEKGLFDLRRERFTREGSPFRVAWRSRPAIIEAAFGFGGIDSPALLFQDWDGDIAVLRPAEQGGVEVGSVTKLRSITGKPITPSGTGGHWGRALLAVADWDGDGRWDILLGTGGFMHKFFLKEPYPREASPMWLRNVGSNAEPIFSEPAFIRSREGGYLEFGAHNASPWAADLDADGRQDLLIGAEDGRIYVFPRDQLDDRGNVGALKP